MLFCSLHQAGIVHSAINRWCVFCAVLFFFAVSASADSSLNSSLRSESLTSETRDSSYSSCVKDSSYNSTVRDRSFNSSLGESDFSEDTLESFTEKEAEKDTKQD